MRLSRDRLALSPNYSGSYGPKNYTRHFWIDIIDAGPLGAVRNIPSSDK